MSGTEDFTLDPQLAADCHRIGELPLSRVLLLDDRRYPWVILVPRRAGVREIYELTHADRAALLEESCLVGAAMMRLFGGEKLNIGALGNLVAQLHVHHVVRFSRDPAWPGPVWGHSPAVAYGAAERDETLGLLRSQLPLTG